MNTVKETEKMIQFSPSQAFFKSIMAISKAAPKELSYLTILTLVSGVGSAFVLWLNKVIIDQISYLFLEQDVSQSAMNLLVSHPLLIANIVGIVVVNLLYNLTGTTAMFAFTSLRDRVQGVVQGQVLYKIATFEDIALFETPELLNLVQLAERGVERLQELSRLIFQLLKGLFLLIPAMLLSATIAWWVPLALLGCGAPAMYVNLKYRKLCWGAEVTQASVVREMNLCKMALSEEAYAKELRLLHLQSLLIERWRELFRRVFKAMEQIRGRGTRVVVFWSLLSQLGFALPYVHVVLGVIGRDYSLGNLVLYSGLILQVRRGLETLIRGGAEVYGVALEASPIFQLMKLQPQLSRPQRLFSYQFPVDEKSSPASQQGIQIRNLSFTYPQGTHQTLKNVTFTLQPNEMVALVGENGAGKTTLAKLLCRLYDPDGGAIIWNGKDLRSLSLEELHSRIAVVMQDYSRFPTTVRENVGFGSPLKLQDDSAILQAIAEAGMSEVIEHLTQGLETHLGKQLEGGVDLSGGQWQRIAIARALIRLSQVELLVLDEPTANLDPKTEHKIYEIFRDLAKGRMSIIVSHRLALAKLADRIIVLEQGRILEVGTHEELMQFDGEYRSMFERQASSYS